MVIIASNCGGGSVDGGAISLLAMIMVVWQQW